MNSNQKGKKGELELAAILKSYGYEDSRRGQQYCGSNGDADVVKAFQEKFSEAKCDGW